MVVSSHSAARPSGVHATTVIAMQPPAAATATLTGQPREFEAGDS
jgi:hypothetical protein